MHSNRQAIVIYIRHLSLILPSILGFDVDILVAPLQIEIVYLSFLGAKKNLIRNTKFYERTEILVRY